MTLVDNISRLQQEISLIREAQTQAENECAEVKAERDALNSFKKVVKSCQVEHHQPTVAAPYTVSLSEFDSLATIRNSYRETVMNTAHYDSAYAESIVENWEAEFGPELAAWLASDNPVTAQFKSSLLTAVNECYRDRREGVKILEAEVLSLSESYSILKTAIDEIEEQLGNAAIELTTTSKAHLERECETVVQSRQKFINRQRSINGHDFCSYLYNSYSWTYPVLTAVTSILELAGVEC